MAIDASLPRKARRRARELALQLVYAWDQKRCEDDGHLLVDDERTAGDEDPVLRESARRLFEVLCKEQPAIDATMEKYLKNWTVRRLAVTERCLLRLGCCELLYDPGVPARVIINEYIELTKEYGSEAKSAKLVNAVLDRVGREHRAAEMPQRG